MTSRTCFATAFYHAQGYAPNLGRLGNLRKFSAYYKCMVVLFASIRGLYQSEKLILFTNCQIVPKYQALLDTLKVSIIIIPEGKLIYVTDKSIVNSFPGCLFSLDVLEYVVSVKLTEEIDSLFLLDSDCLLLNKMDEVIKQVEQSDAVTGICLNSDIDRNMNGQTRSALTLIFNKIASTANRKQVKTLDYFGGEFYGFSARTLPLISTMVRQYWQFIKEQVPTHGNSYTEEHVLSMAINQLNDKLFLREHVIKRIWTADQYNNIDGSELNFSLLHMPSEKNKLFRNIYHCYMRDADFFYKISEGELKKIVGRQLKNVAEPSFMRQCIITLKKVLKNIIFGVISST